MSHYFDSCFCSERSDCSSYPKFIENVHSENRNILASCSHLHKISFNCVTAEFGHYHNETTTAISSLKGFNLHAQSTIG